MKKILSLLALMLLTSIGAWAATTTADLVVSTNKTTPEKTFFVVGTSNGYFWNGTTSPTGNKANRSEYAFFATSTENVYQILNVTANKWLGYTAAASYSQQVGFVTLDSDEANAGMFYMEKVNNKDASTPCYQISPMKTDDTKASIYLNWLYGPTDSRNGVDGTVTVGIYGSAATGDAGSGWSLLSTAVATPEEITAAKAIIRTGVGYPKTSNAAYTALNGLNEGALLADVQTAKENYINCTDINLPEDGHAYKFSMVSKDGNKVWALVANGNTLNATLGGEATTFYCHKINNGNSRYVFIADNGKIFTFHALTDNYDKLYTGSNYFVNDFVVEPMVGKMANINSTNEQRLGYVALITDHRPTGQTGSKGCFILQESNGTFAATTVPFHNGTYTSAVKVEEVSYTPSSDMTLIVAKIDALVQGYLTKDLYGEEFGKYTIADHEGTKYAWADYNTSIWNATQRADVQGYEITLNMPKPGSFLRVKGKTSGKYISGNNTASGNIPLVEGADENSILCYTEAGELIGYKNGRGSKNTSQQAGVSETKDKHQFLAAPVKGAYMIKAITSTENSKILVDWTSGKVDRWAKENDERSNWILEAVESLPIKLNEVDSKFYGTINLPVAVTIPEGLKAYSAVASDSELSLTKVVEDGVLAANTPVVLYAESDVTELAIASEVGEGADGNELAGTVAAATVTSGENYVLSGSNGVAGFYKYNGTTMPGFKAYLPASAKASANKLSFRFEDVITAIEAIESSNSAAEIFDLQGRRLNKAQKGMNIINGHKVLVK